MSSGLTTQEIAVENVTTTRSYRVLQVLDCSLPVVAGYTVRSRDIVNAQRAIGFFPTVVTGPLHELLDKTSCPLEIEGTRYHRTQLKGIRGKLIRNRVPVLSQASVVQLLKKRILQVLDSGQYDVVHAHSPVLCGLAGLQAARARKLPFVYEIRAFWEDAAVDQNKTTEKSLRYRGTRALEQHVIGGADAVVCIAENMLNDLESRGFSRNKLFHVPNGVDIEKFKPRARDAELATKLGIGNKTVFGFIGTLFRFEGVRWLVEAAAQLKQQGQQFKLIIVGDGEDAADTKAAIAALNASEYILFTGRVPADEVARYYSIMDVLVYPRVSIRLTELVTPLKPLEAMSQDKAVLASNVGGLRELVQHDLTGLTFTPGDKEDFCRQAARLFDPDLRHDLALQGRQHVIESRNWISIARRYEKVYKTASRTRN